MYKIKIDLKNLEFQKDLFCLEKNEQLAFLRLLTLHIDHDSAYT